MKRLASLLLVVPLLLAGCARGTTSSSDARRFM